MSSQAKSFPIKKASKFATLIRPHMSLLPLIIFTSVLIINNFSISIFLLGWILLISSYGVVVIQNNIADIEIDKANKRLDNPLATGSLKLVEVHYALLASYTIGLAAAFLIKPILLLWFIAYIFFGWLYSGKFMFKNKGSLAILILAICYGIMPWVLGAIASETKLSIGLLVVMLSSFFYVFGIISLKDFKDIKGDKKYKKKTLLVSKGVTFTQKFIIFFTCTGYLILLLFTVWQNHGLLFLAGLLIALVNTAILYSDKIINSPGFRGRYGKLLRFSFFLYSIIVYAAS